MKTYKKLVGNKIRELRKRKGFKTYEVAEMIGLNPGTYRNMESGSQLPASLHMENLGRLFNCTIEELTWDSKWNDLVENKTVVLDEYIHPMIKEISLRKNKKRAEIEQNILKSILLEVEDYKDSEFKSFILGDDFLDIYESAKTEIEMRVNQLHKKYLKSKNPSEERIGIAPNGIKYKYKDI